MQVNPFPSKRPVRFEMVPLIDMFFLLLVFFIFGVFSMTMQQGLMVELPPAVTATASQEDTVTVSVTGEGAVFLNQEPVTLQTLPAHLAALSRQPEPIVLINADTAARYGVVIAVLDAVRGAGLARVSFTTQPAEGLR
jgi:biopolymer transport protein ExbD